MVEIDLFKLVLLVLAILITAVLVPVLLQLLRTLRLLETTLVETRVELLPLLRDLREAAGRLNRASAGVEAGMAELNGLFAAIGEVRRGLDRLGSSLQHGFAHTLGSWLGLWFGLRSRRSQDNPEQKGE